jgi:hypothetical protein
MIEIAFSLAIVAFALVAIMGVLPTGMTVQRDNREDTMINGDASFWLETLRSGSHGVDDLTNYVEEILITGTDGSQIARVTNSFGPGSQITSGEQIVGMLLTPKNVNGKGTIVTARVRALNGSATEKANRQQESFRYEIQSELTPLPVEAMRYDPKNGAPFQATALQTNFHDLRLTMRWPIFEMGNGNWGGGVRTERDTDRRSRRVVRGAVAGQLTFTNGLYFVQPNVYQYVTNYASAPQQ